MGPCFSYPCRGPDAHLRRNIVATSLGLSDVVIVDLPDVTSKMSADEGSITRTLLPWFDGLIIVADEERWFDAVVKSFSSSYRRTTSTLCRRCITR